MKTKLLLLALSIFASTTTYSQCSRSGDFIASSSDPGLYTISGTVSVNFTTSGTKEIVLENNFATVQGADLRMYLSTTDDIEAPGSVNIEVSPQLLNDNPNGGAPTGSGGPGVSPITGIRTFTLPSNVELNDYSFVVIQCIVIGERWGHAPLAATNGPDCQALSIEELELENTLQLYPNPAITEVSINNPKQLEISVSIFNILGKKVYTSDKNSLITNYQNR